MTAEDVVYCLSRLIDPEISGKAVDFAGVESIEAEGNNVIITLQAPNAAFLALLTEFGASVYPPEEEENLFTRQGHRPCPCPVGANSQLVLEKFADYWHPDCPSSPGYPEDNTRTGHGETVAHRPCDLIPRLRRNILTSGRCAGFKDYDSPMNLIQLLIINAVPPL